MGHLSVTVLVPSHSVDRSNRDTVHDLIEEQLAPYDQNAEVELHESECYCVEDGLTDPECGECHGTGKFLTTDNAAGKWDWWRIGGRFTGIWVADYDPEADPQNMEPCPSCTGADARSSQTGCVSCQGIGQRLKWPTHWRDFDRDILPVSEVRTDAVTYALLTPSGQWHEAKNFHVVTGYSPEWEQQYRGLMAAHVNCLAVAVDCHE